MVEAICVSIILPFILVGFNFAGRRWLAGLHASFGGEFVLAFSAYDAAMAVDIDKFGGIVTAVPVKNHLQLYLIICIFLTILAWLLVLVCEKYTPHVAAGQSMTTRQKLKSAWYRLSALAVTGATFVLHLLPLRVS